MRTALPLFLPWREKIPFTVEKIPKAAKSRPSTKSATTARHTSASSASIWKKKTATSPKETPRGASCGSFWNYIQIARMEVKNSAKKTKNTVTRMTTRPLALLSFPWSSS